MRFEKYLNETKMGKLPGKVTRIAHGGDPFELEWNLINSNSDDQRSNYKFIENLAYGELMAMKRKKIIDFYEDQFNVSMSTSINGETDYQVEVKLKSYDDKKLRAELRKLKFKVLR